MWFPAAGAFAPLPLVLGVPCAGDTGPFMYSK